MKKYQYLASWDDQTLTRVGEPVVVLGDSNVSQVEVTLPSNFLLDPTKAECRMYFLLPGEKESEHDVLETATKDENGDSHVAWTIKHVHSQKGGRLAFSLTLIGDDAQWDSRTAIIPVYESRYQPESEEAEKPYTGRLDALEGSMASIRGEFAEVQDDFEELKETATLGTPIPESLVANMQAGHIYVYTGTETGYTAGHLYYYVNGTLTDGGQYGGTTVDATLTQSGQAADAKVTGDKIAEIKEDLSAVDGVVNDLNTEVSIIDTYTKTSIKHADIIGSLLPTANVSWGYRILKPLSLFMYKQTGITADTFTVNVYKKDTANTSYYDNNIRRDYITLINTFTFNKSDFIILENLDADTYIEIVFTNRAIKYTTTDTSLPGLFELGNYGVRNEVFMYSSNPTSFGDGRLSGEYIIVPKDTVGSILNSKKISCIGDSITEYNARAGVNWIMWLEKWCGCTIQNLGQSGRGFVNDYEGTSYISKISSIDADADIIVVASSFNDVHTGKGLNFDWSTESGRVAGKVYIDAFWNALISAFPTTPAICFCEGPWENSRPYIASSDGYLDTVRQSCAEHGIPFYDGLYYGSVLRPWVEPNRNVYYKSDNIKLGNTGRVDNQHPNSEGHKVIARYLIDKVSTNLVGEWLNYT